MTDADGVLALSAEGQPPAPVPKTPPDAAVLMAAGGDPPAPPAKAAFKAPPLPQDCWPKVSLPKAPMEEPLKTPYAICRPERLAEGPYLGCSPLTLTSELRSAELFVYRTGTAAIYAESFKGSVLDSSIAYVENLDMLRLLSTMPYVL